MPKVFQKQTLELAHEGHQGVVCTKQRLREKVWWPGIDRDAEHRVRACNACQLVGLPPKPEPMVRTDLPSGPWEQVAIDLCGPFPTGESLLVITDYFSRWPEVVVVRKTTTVLGHLDLIFARHGFPVSIVSDNGPQFVAAEFKDYMIEHGICHRRVTPYWPQANGQVERQNRAIQESVPQNFSMDVKFALRYHPFLWILQMILYMLVTLKRNAKEKSTEIVYARHVPET